MRYEPAACGPLLDLGDEGCVVLRLVEDVRYANGAFVCYLVEHEVVLDEYNSVAGCGEFGMAG